MFFSLALTSKGICDVCKFDAVGSFGVMSDVQLNALVILSLNFGLVKLERNSVGDLSSEGCWVCDCVEYLLVLTSWITVG